MPTRGTLFRSYFCSFSIKIITATVLPLFLISCKNSPKVLWSFKTGSYVYATPVLVDNTLLIGSTDHNLYALNKQTGDLIWKANLGERVLSKPLIDGDSIYIGNGKSEFYCLNLKDGKTKWKIQTGRLATNYDACMDKDSVYFGSHDERFYKVSKTGEMIWSFQTDAPFRSGCVLYKDLALTSCMDKNFYGFDTKTGLPRWKAFSDHHNFGPPELVGDDVYFSTHEKIFKIEAATGKVLNQFKATYVMHAFPVKDHLWSYEEQGLVKRTMDGQPIATAPFVAFTQFRPVVTDNYFIIGATDSMLYGISFEPKIIWEYKGKDYFWGSGVVSDGIYYTGNRDTRVYALRLPK